MSPLLDAMLAVMKCGEIVEQGSHQELMQRPGGAYATLVRLQTSTQLEPHEAVQPLDSALQLGSEPVTVQAYSPTQVCQAG